jgi:hypothetical protein
VLEPLCKRLGQTSLPDLSLRPLHRVLDAPVLGPVTVEVEQHVGGPRIAVAWLPDRARVEDPASLAREVKVRPTGRDDRLEALVG